MLARTLKDKRLNKGLSVEQLSKRSGVSWSIIHQIESGSPSYVPSEGNTVLLAKVLRAPAGPLLAGRSLLVERQRPRP